MKNKVCFIFSVFNEEKNPIFWENLRLMKKYDLRFIIVDGGSSDRTTELLSDKFLSLPVSTRGQRFDYALKHCHLDYVIFVHPRTLLTEELYRTLDQILTNQWGAFTHSFDQSQVLLNFTSWYSNFVRGDLTKIYYLDHILFCQSSLAKKVGFPHDPVYEDTLFCKRLQPMSDPVRLKAKTITSSLRFKENGYIYQSVVNQITKLLFFMGVSTQTIYDFYELGLHLNQNKLLARKLRDENTRKKIE